MKYQNSQNHDYLFLSGGSIREETTQIGMFANSCVATDLNEENTFQETDPEKQYKMCFDGCGVTNGISVILILFIFQF